MNQTLFFFISAFMLMPFAFASGISLPVEAVTYPLLIGVISVLVVSFFYLKFINKNFSFGRFVKFMGAYIWM